MDGATREDQTALLCGQVASALSRVQLLDDLASVGLRVEMRESCHYEEGHYIRIRVDSDLSLERIDGGRSYLIRGDADTPSDLLRDAEVLSAALCRLGLRHRMEIYDSLDTMVGYLHWSWPIEIPAEQSAAADRPRE